LQTVIYLLFIRAVDLYERESLRYVIPVFVWGFAVATTVSLFLQHGRLFTISSIAGQQAANFLTPSSWRRWSRRARRAWPCS
jgi:hypothetical protein